MKKYLLFTLILFSCAMVAYAVFGYEAIDDEECLYDWIEEEGELDEYRELGHKGCMEECLVRAYTIDHCMNQCD